MVLSVGWSIGKAHVGPPYRSLACVGKGLELHGQDKVLQHHMAWMASELRSMLLLRESASSAECRCLCSRGHGVKV